MPVTTKRKPAKRRVAKPSKTPQSRSKPSELSRLHRGRKAFGLGVAITVGERQGEAVTVRRATLEKVFARPGLRPKTQFLESADAADLANRITGLAHADRIRIARAIFLGAEQHHAIRDAVGLKAGPLYHHLRALERAGIIEKTGRNEYRMTAIGRQLLLILTTAIAAENGQSARWRP